MQYVGAVSGSAINGGDVTLDLTALSGGAGSAAIAGDWVVTVGGWLAGSVAGGSGPSTAGYTKSAEYTSANSGLLVAHKLMVTPDTSVVLKGSGNANDGTVYGAMVWRGCPSDTPIGGDKLIKLNSAGGSGTPDSAADTTTVASSAVISFGIKPVNVSGLVAPSGYTKICEAAANDTNPSTMGLAYKIVPAIGSEDPGAWTTFPGSGGWLAFTFIIAPRGGDGNFFALLPPFN